MFVPSGLGPPFRVVAVAPGKSTVVYVCAHAIDHVANATLIAHTATNRNTLIMELPSCLSFAPEFPFSSLRLSLPEPQEAENPRALVLMSWSYGFGRRAQPCDL